MTDFSCTNVIMNLLEADYIKNFKVKPFYRFVTLNSVENLIR